jgi:hypothetical protein
MVGAVMIGNGDCASTATEAVCTALAINTGLSAGAIAAISFFTSPSNAVVPPPAVAVSGVTPLRMIPRRGQPGVRDRHHRGVRGHHRHEKLGRRT